MTTNERSGWPPGGTPAATIGRHPAEQAGKVRALTAAELAALRRDMAEASAWMRAELKRRKSS